MAEDTTNSGSFCGIGTTPIPNNDPDLNNSSISAFPVRFGIQVHWSYPNKNPEMMAFSEVYRSTGPNLEANIEPEAYYNLSSGGVAFDGDTDKVFAWLDTERNYSLGFDAAVPGYAIGDAIVIGSTEDPNWGFEATVTGFFNYGTGIKTSQDTAWSIVLDQPGGQFIHKQTTTGNYGAVRIGRVSADNYTDVLEENQKGIKYYYWVRHTSIHGTVGDYIGPASATWNGSIDDILEWLQGLITNSQLDQDLRDRINDISDISTGLRDEIADREGLGLTLNQLIAEVKQNLEDTDALVGSAVTEIVNDNHALAASVNIVMAQWDNNFAGVQDEVFAVTKDTLALAGDIKTVQSKLLRPGGDPNNPDDYYLLSVQEEFITSISADVGDLNQLGSVPVYELDAEGNLLLDADGNPVVNEDPSISDRLLDVYGQWSIRIDNNGHVSGLGLRSSGADENAFSEFIVNANVFAIGAPEDLNDPDSEAVQKRPFIVYQDGDGNNLIAMDTDVFIRNGTIKNAMIDNVIQSTDWQQWGPGINQFNGWMIDKGGDVYIDNLTAKGNITANHLEAGSANIIDTLMIQDNAVTIPEGVHIPFGGGIGEREEIEPRIKNLATITMIWGRDGVSPQAFIINAIYMAFGAPIGWTQGDGDGELAPGDGIITIVGEYGYTDENDRMIHPASETVQYQSYAVSMQKGYGAMVTGLWHVVPPRDYYHWAHFTLRGRTNPGQHPREISNAVMSILGAKR